MTAFAFIFARGGSKGLPGKNIKPLAGKPLLHYSIETAQQSGLFDKVFVSTDSADIAHCARQAGAVVIDRPAELASDTAPEWLAWRHAVQWVREHEGQFDTFVSLPATSPLRSVTDVVDAVAKREACGADICISVTSSGRNPYFNMVTITPEGHCELATRPATPVFRRQDAPEIFDITTVVYATTPGFVMEKMGLFQGVVTSIEVPKVRAVDIDDIYDFMLAEAIVSQAQ